MQDQIIKTYGIKTVCVLTCVKQAALGRVIVAALLGSGLPLLPFWVWTS